MRPLQKAIAVVGAVLIAATTFVAPYTVRGVNQIVAATGGNGRFEYTAHAPLWSGPEPSAADQITIAAWDAQLDAGRLGIWWAGIVLATVLAMVLAAPGPRGQAEPAQRASPEPARFRRMGQ